MFTNLALIYTLALPLAAQFASMHGNKPLLDAHNCYPYDGKWADRVDRALSTGFPVAIEQDLGWFDGRAVVTHTAKTTGSEPTLKTYFFERVRPMVEKAMKENKRAQWPLIVVHFDFKDNRPELLRAVWTLLGEYQGWLSTARKTGDPRKLSPLKVGPLLVLTEDSYEQEQVFFGDVKKGELLRLFGSAHTTKMAREQWATAPPEQLLTERPTNYRRWWNNSWHEVEEGGQTKAGDWTVDDDARLRALVNHAHRLGYWIRFYTLDGFAAASGLGWDAGYNFGSREAVEKRWHAAIEAGVNLIATDQYEDLAAFMKTR